MKNIIIKYEKKRRRNPKRARNALEISSTVPRSFSPFGNVIEITL